MILKLIQDTNCPVCKSHVVAESCEHVHCNGEGFEVRKFKCGCVLRWSPNFSRLEVESPCPKSPNEITRREKEINALRQVEELIGKLDVSESWKARAKQHLKYI